MVRLSLKRLLREPLLHFALFGAIIFAVNAWLNGPGTQARPRVDMTPAEIEHLRTLWQRTWQRPPTPGELRGAIDARVREEILYREALAMGLDKDDTVVRRRLMQKLEFLSEDILVTGEPKAEDLEAYFREHAERYREPARISFSQVFFNVDRHGIETDAKARTALQILTATENALATAGQGLGDHLFTIESDYFDHSLLDIARTFGKEFADRITELQTGQWQGPVASGYGLHVVFIKERTSGRMPALAEVRESVVRDYEQARREEASKAFYARLKERYDIVIDQTALNAAAPAGSLAEVAR